MIKRLLMKLRIAWENRNGATIDSELRLRIVMPGGRVITRIKPLNRQTFLTGDRYIVNYEIIFQDFTVLKLSEDMDFVFKDGTP